MISCSLMFHRTELFLKSSKLKHFSTLCLSAVLRRPSWVPNPCAERWPARLQTN